MNPTQAALQERIQAFRFDADGATYPFAMRLAKENGWSRDFTDRVIEEYRRFAFLAVAAGHPVSPPDAVDQAWHLHLLYTRSYWDEFCGRVLCTPLHHEPSRGGTSERAKFDDWYARTVHSYRRLFAQDPPPDIWPEPGSMPGPVQPFRRVDMVRHWVVRKPRAGPAGAWRILAPAVALPLFVIGCVTAATIGASGQPSSPADSSIYNPFDLRGPEFLAFYAVALAVAWCVAASIRSRSRGPAEPPAQDLDLDPYQVAYLNGGKAQALNAAVASLVHRGVLTADHATGTLTLIQPDGRPDDALEQGVCAAATRGGGAGVRMQDVWPAAAPALAAIADGLKRAGLLVADGPSRAAVARGTLVALLVPAMGLVKIGVGLSRHKPVEFLVVACIASGIAAGLVFGRRPHRTRRGDAVLRGLRSMHSRLQANPLRGGPDAVALGVALFGLGSLGGTPLSFLERALTPHRSDASGWAASSCGGSSCGGSSCGGGSGGGGGCGGCGGH